MIYWTAYIRGVRVSGAYENPRIESRPVLTVDDVLDATDTLARAKSLADVFGDLRGPV